MGINFNNMLKSEGIDPKLVIVLRHRPRERELRKALPWLASECLELFNAYQQTQSGINVEHAIDKLVGKGYIASFIGQTAAQATFVGLFRIAGARPLTRAQFLALPVYQQIHKLAPEAKNWYTPELEAKRPTIQFFDLQMMDFYTHWKGCLVVSWPPPERSWWRRAHRNDLPIHAVHERSVFDAVMPAWDEINVSWEELRVLPSSWKAAMSQWRGIYYIYDISTGKGYVGSAYGHNNLLGRWENYGASGHGGNKLLRKCDSANFRFSILQRVSPDMDTNDIIALENNWKERLHTRAPHGLNDN